MDAVGEALGCERLDDGVPALLESPDALSELLVLLLLRGFAVCLRLSRLAALGGGLVAGAEETVLLLELGYALLEVAVVGLAAVAGVLGGDAVTMGAGFFTLFG